MKKEELRIGNFYMSVKFGIPVECTLADLYELCVKSDGAYGDPPIEEMFEPIPITEEWLFKLGFKRWTSKRRDRTYSNGLVIIHERKSGYSLAARYVRYIYVHDLQTLCYALTGEELTIKEK